MVKAIHRKLFRDLWELKGQVAAISVVLGAGVMVLILAVTILDAVSLSKDRFYQTHNFAHVFCDLKRAPEFVSSRLEEVPGVSAVQTRVAAPVRLEVPGFEEPVRGRVLSIPDGDQPLLNSLYLRRGSLPDPDQPGQAVISEPLAQAHSLEPGDELRAIIRGRLETLTISGVALSPEFVYQLGPADLIPDHQRFGVLWMNRRDLEAAFDMQGAFNSALVSLRAGTHEASVLDALDEILAPYGGVGAYGREDQVSHRFLQDELDQLRVMAVILPLIFLGVAAFLLSVLLSRIISTQRRQIAVLKAFGYTNQEIGLHYILFSGLIVTWGCILGVVLGLWAAGELAALYGEYFRFPELVFRLRPRILALAVFVALTAALLGIFREVRGAVRSPPAEAMRPPAPESFSRGAFQGPVWNRILDQTGRIILRNLARKRFKAVMSVLGIALSGSLLLLGSYQFGSVDHMLDTQYRLVQKMDVHLVFTESVHEQARRELEVLPGVLFVETYRNVPVRLRYGQRDYRTTIMGMEQKPALRGILDRNYSPVKLPLQGLVLTDYLAGHLGVEPGDRLQVEIMEGRRRNVEMEVARLVQEPIGVGAYMERRALNRVMREGPAVSGAWLLTDHTLHFELYEHLWDTPAIAGIGVTSQAEANIRGYIQDTALGFMAVLLVMAGSIAFAVVYNNARIAYEERYRELATLRVLGLTRMEVGWILVGEILVVTLAAIPLGWLLGAGFAYGLNQALSTDFFRLPFVLEPGVFAFSAAGVLLATFLSVLLMLRRLRRLDMVEALKTE